MNIIKFILCFIDKEMNNAFEVDFIGMMRSLITIVMILFVLFFILMIMILGIISYNWYMILLSFGLIIVIQLGIMCLREICE